MEAAARTGAVAADRVDTTLRERPTTLRPEVHHA